jgi:hypothetical protein
MTTDHPTANPNDARRARGAQVIRDLNEGRCQPALEALRTGFPFLAEAIECYALGDVWSRSGLDARSRQIAAVSAFAALGDLAFMINPCRLCAQRRRHRSRIEGSRESDDRTCRFSARDRGRGSPEQPVRRAVGKQRRLTFNPTAAVSDRLYPPERRSGALRPVYRRREKE